MTRGGWVMRIIIPACSAPKSACVHRHDHGANIVSFWLFFVLLDEEEEDDALGCELW